MRCLAPLVGNHPSVSTSQARKQGHFKASSDLRSARRTAGQRRSFAVTAWAALLFLMGAGAASAQTISATTYPFTNATGATLEDMSSGTTTLLGPNLDDNASLVANIEIGRAS